MESAKIAKENNFCRDCGKKVEIEGDKLKNAKVLVYANQGEKIKIIKCDDCFAKNPSLADFQKCEVYSRIVGYLRPVGQWNVGKKREYREREEYKPSCCD